MFRFICGLSFFLTTSLFAQTDPSLEVQKVLSKGINFDHIFLPHEGAKPLDAAKWQAIHENLKEAEFAQIASLGFTHIRLNLGRGFIQDFQPPYALDPAGLALLDQAVQMALHHGLGIVIDLHQTPASDIFHDPKALESYRVLWKALAQHFKGQPISVIFELMNEPAVKELTQENPAPADLAHWRSIVQGLVDIVHQEDPDRFIIVSGGGWGSAANLIQTGDLQRPRLIYTFHFYSPFMFTHQGATWMDKSLSTLRGIRYPVDAVEVTLARKNAQQNGYPLWPFDQAAGGYNQENMKKDLQSVFDLAAKNKWILYCGEFGAHKPYADPQDRAQWISDVGGVLQEHQVGGAMWAYHAGFDLVDKQGVPDPLILKALGLGSK